MIDIEYVETIVENIQTFPLIRNKILGKPIRREATKSEIVLNSLGTETKYNKSAAILQSPEKTLIKSNICWDTI